MIKLYVVLPVAFCVFFALAILIGGINILAYAVTKQQNN